MWSRGIQHNMQEAIVGSFQNWLLQHPFLLWLVTHPLWSVGIVLLAIFLFWGLLQAVTRLTERIWLFILQAPLKLIQGGFRVLTFLISRKTPETTPIEVQKEDPRQRLTTIVNRLEALRQEQDALMQEMKQLLAIENS
ncbi:MAG: hypothetical protein SFW36_06855 [Leptolyngbyaceae cyanobacterium bins.59]|nr:hypothetical protein [Leptolyngbyaceae cyanobacterium bins.59]